MGLGTSGLGVVWRVSVNYFFAAMKSLNEMESVLASLGLQLMIIFIVYSSVDYYYNT